MKRIALLALLSTALTAGTVAYAGQTPAAHHLNGSSHAEGYRPGEDWNDFVARQGWRGRGRSEKVLSAVVAPMGEPTRDSELQSTTHLLQCPPESARGSSCSITSEGLSEYELAR